MKKTVIVLMLLTLLCAFPVCAQAAELLGSGYVTDTITWAYDSDGTLVVKGTGALPDYVKNEADAKDGLLWEGKDLPWHIWTGDSKYSQYADHQKPFIKRIVVGDGITYIGKRAFVNCLYLDSIEIADSVESIAASGVGYCYTLKDSKIIIPDHTQLDKNAFRDAAAETSIIASRDTSYTDSKYFDALTDVKLTGNYRTDIINIAKSQIGYHEGSGPEDYDGMNTDSKKDYTEYGRFAGSGAAAWCSEFALWCARMAGVPTNILNVSRSAVADNWVSGTDAVYYTWEDTIYGGGEYEPQPGDILQWAWDNEEHTASEELDHTSTFNGATENGSTVTIHSIDGNVSQKVRTKDYKLNADTGMYQDSSGAWDQLVFIIAPNYERKVTKYTVSFSCEGETFPSKTVAEKGRYGVLPMPEKRAGYRFDWYTAQTGGERVNMYTEVKLSADQTLYGRWERIPEVGGKLGAISYAYYDGALHLSGTLNEGEFIYAASYLDDGRMLGTQIVSSTDDALSFGDECGTVKLMLVDANGKPLCTAKKISLN